jgi:hypothetical protein
MKARRTTMLSKKTILSRRTQAVGFGIVFLLVVISVHQIAPAAAYSENPTDILIVTNQNVSADSVSLTFVRDLFLKYRKEWSNGEKAVSINANDERLRDDFRKKVLNMDHAAEQRFWQEAKLKYGQSEPPAFSNNLKAVFKLQGSVSYVHRRGFLPGVAKVIYVVPVSDN